MWMRWQSRTRQNNKSSCQGNSDLHGTHLTLYSRCFQLKIAMGMSFSWYTTSCKYPCKLRGGFFGCHQEFSHLSSGRRHGQLYSSQGVSDIVGKSKVINEWGCMRLIISMAGTLTSRGLGRPRTSGPKQSDQHHYSGIMADLSGHPRY